MRGMDFDAQYADRAVIIIFGQFPHPMPDETLHSLLARYYVSSIYLNWRSMANDLAGRPWIESVNSVPVGLEHMDRVFAAVGLSSEEILWSHSYFPYYTALLSEKEREKYRDLAWRHETKESMISLGGLLRQNRIGPFLRFCPRCMWDDLQKRGFTYWRRRHQLPGVWVCDVHGGILLESPVSCNDFDQPGFGVAEVETVFPARAAADLNRREWELAMLIAQGQRSCLQQPGEVNRLLTGNHATVSATVKRLLYKKSFASASGQVNYQRLCAEFLKFYGPNLLRRTGLLGEQGQLVWLKELYREKRFSPNALKMVLGGIFLAESFEVFLREIEVVYREAA